MSAKESGSKIAEDTAKGCGKGCLWAAGEVYDVFTFEMVWRNWRERTENTEHPGRVTFAGLMEKHRLLRGFALLGSTAAIIYFCNLTSFFAN